MVSSRAAAQVMAALGTAVLVCLLAVESTAARKAHQSRPEQVLLPPSPAHPFGTDEIGRDMLARTLVAVSMGFRGSSAALLVAGSLAIVLGGLAGWCRQTPLDWAISWVISLLHTVPFLLVVAAAAAVLRPGWIETYLLVGAVAWATPARLVRAEVMRVRASRHVAAMRAYGMPLPLLLLRAAVPVAAAPVVLSLVMFLPELLVLDVALSFFGLGAQPPTPTLGRLILSGFSRLESAPWLSLFPALCLVLLCVIISRAVPSGRYDGAKGR